ncbi:hypothetical protein L596_003434 [Steinernema carpocapsae]|uniref:Uncharacterized protein n=1 Tax=Steinernema carpocapsae TaxID=34508 RepID=A0A4U8UU60_STECR|nr:hypothetical protein L596_003434 [Steinernema carpocapsae]
MLLPRILLLLLVIVDSAMCAKEHYFVFENLSPPLLKLARLYGNEAHKDYVQDTENRTELQRQTLYTDYFERCNDLGWDYAKNVTMMVAKKSNSTRYRTLMKMGVRAFLSRFLTLPVEQINSGIDQLCTKSEMQLQCQFGFGESRSQILLRIEHLKEFDGSMRLLLDKECNAKRKELHYECIGGEVEEWAKDCMNTAAVHGQLAAKATSMRRRHSYSRTVHSTFA